MMTPEQRAEFCAELHEAPESDLLMGHMLADLELRNLVRAEILTRTVVMLKYGKRAKTQKGN